MICFHMQEPVHVSNMLCAVTQKHTHSFPLVSSFVLPALLDVSAVTQISPKVHNCLAYFASWPRNMMYGGALFCSWTKTLSSMVSVLATSHHSCFLLLVVNPASSSLLWLFHYHWKGPFHICILLRCTSCCILQDNAQSMSITFFFKFLVFSSIIIIINFT